VADKIRSVLGPIAKFQGDTWRAAVLIKLPRAFRDFAVCEGKNFQKAFEFNLSVNEPTISKEGLVFHCYIGLWQPWADKNPYTMTVFSDCDGLARAVETMAEFYDCGLGVTVMGTIVKPCGGSFLWAGDRGGSEGCEICTMSCRDALLICF